MNIALVLRSCKSLLLLRISRHLPLSYHSSTNHPPSPNPSNPETPTDLFSTTQIATPSKIHKLISTQSDPLLAHEIFHLATRQPNFHHSYSTYHSLILKLARARLFTFIKPLLLDLIRLRYPASPALFSNLIRFYGHSHLPQQALNTFYTIPNFNCHPTSKHLKILLAILVTHRNFLRPAFDLFRVAHKYGVDPDVESYNIMMRAFCCNGEISVAYKLFNQMAKRGVMPSVESYKILMQALCRKSQVNTAVDLLEDMLNKGFVPDTLSYITLLNSLCRKKQLKEAYKLLCRMKVRGCNPNIVHYNTVIVGLCREGRALDAIKVLTDMESNECLPDLESYRTLVGGLVEQGMHDEARKYMEEMMGNGFSPHFSIAHCLVKGLCDVGKVEDASGVLNELLKHGEVPHASTWQEIIPRVCENEEMERLGGLLDDVMKVEVGPHTRIVDAGAALEEYLIKKIKAKSRKA